MTDLYLGLISGTSIDGIDTAIIDTSQQKPQLIASYCHPIPSTLKEQIAALCNPTTSALTADPIDLLGEVDITLGQLFAEAAIELLKQAGIHSSTINAIGSHGQTVRHRPPTTTSAQATHTNRSSMPQNAKGFTLQNTNGFTLQIADPNTIAELTGIKTVADFRRRDMATGGQGAPLAPAFHQAISPDEQASVFLNLGGIANLTLLDQGKLVSAYDTGPANGLMDAFIHKTLQKPYDDCGQWAASGTPSDELLSSMLTDPYFALQSPKSTGREYFNLDWVEQHIQKETELSNNDIQATLLRLTTSSISAEINKLAVRPHVIYGCGGGVQNTALINDLQKQLPDIRITSTKELGIPPDWIEACTFAWLAKKTIGREALELSSITGATHPSVLGAIYPA